MARIRIQRQARRSGANAAADRAVSPSARLVDVVRGDVVALGASVVQRLARQAARRRPRDARVAEGESLS